MIRRARLLGLILALLLAAPPLEAADPPDYEAVLLELDPRLAELANGEEGLLQIAQAVQAYMETRVPQADEATPRAFMANLKARINAMSAAELDDLAFRAARQNSAAEQKRGNESAFHDKLDAVAFYTVASKAVMEDMSRRVAEIERTGEKPQTPVGVAWSRDAAGQFRASDALTPWAAVDESFLEFKRLNDLDWGDKKSFLRRPDPSSPLPDLPSTEDAWVDQFERRLLRLYSDPDVPLSGTLARDLARAQYLMLAPKPAPESDQLVVTDHLVSLAQELGDFAFTPDEFAKLSSAKQRLLARQAAREIDIKLREREQDHDFRTTRLIPDGPLAETEFLALIAAGYVADDVGAGVEHGAVSHRIQWYSLTEFFEKGEGGWHRTPVELYTDLGAFDIRRARVNQASRFAFERNPSVWAHLFDQQGGRGDEPTDLSRPDYLRPILNGRPDLAPLAHRIEIIYRERIANGNRLRDAFRKGAGARLPFSLSREERERIEALDANNAMATGDELYMLGYFKEAEASGGYVRVRDAAGNARPLLIERAARFDTTRDAEAVADTRRQWPDKVRGGEPPSTPRGRPQRIAAHETASTSDYLKRRGPHGASSKPRPEPIGQEEPEAPHPDEAVPRVDPDHRQARLVGEEEDPDAAFLGRERLERQDAENRDEAKADQGEERRPRRGRPGSVEGRR